MAGHVNEFGPIGDDLDALRNQTIDDGAHRLFVAWDGARGKDYAITLVQRHVRMIVVRDPRQRRTRLALASRTQRQYLIRREMTVQIGPAEILHAIEIPGLTRHLHNALHRTSDNHDLAPGSLCGISYRLHARHIGGKGG